MRRSDYITLALAALLAACLAAVAVAQAPDAVQPPNTEFTPHFRDGEEMGWKQRAGALWRADASAETPPALVEGSDTTMTVDFYGLEFQDGRNGLAAGAVCPADTPFDRLGDCERRPAIYHYTAPPGEPAEWRRVELPGAAEPGFVADVAWLGPGRALAVGGTGKYPYREPAGPVSNDDDPAGDGRAWLLEEGVWTELPQDPDMGALTAVDVGPRPGDCGAAATECAIAGGLRQLWTWDGLAFSGVDEVDGGERFRFRVRDVAFRPNGAAEDSRAYAVTSGCCSGSPVDDQPTLLVLHPTPAGLKWHARPAWAGGARDPNGTSRSVVDSVYAMIVSEIDTGQAKPALGFLAAPGADRGPKPTEPASRVVGPIVAKSPLDSASPTEADKVLAVLAAGASAGTYVDGTGTVSGELTNPILADIRLVSGDGDVGRPPYQGLQREVNPALGDTDALMDWAVGELLAGEPGRAVAMTTLQTGEQIPNPLACPGDDPSVRGALGPSATDCRPEDAPAEKMEARRFFRLPSYRLNAYTAVGDGGNGWAVGDKGAIVQLGGDDSATGDDSEPNLPKLGRADVEEPPDTTPWDPFRPVGLSSEPGVVPPLATRPLEPLPSPQLVPGGTPNPTLPFATNEGIGAIAMSPDGRQGWGVGPGEASVNGKPALYHYDGERWFACDAEGVGDQLPADPACESLLPLLKPGSGAQLPNITDVERVPFENDDDPDNDGRFEAIAVGFGHQGSFTLRYDGTRWAQLAEYPATTVGALYDVEMVAPGDGWFSGVTSVTPVLMRFDGETATMCQTAEAACGLPPGLIDWVDTSGRIHLSAAGRRIYLAANRETGDQANGETPPTFPLIAYKDAPAEDGGPDPQWRTDNGGYDPSAGAQAADQGWVSGLSVAQDGDDYVGWVLGRFGSDSELLAKNGPTDVRRRLGGMPTVPAMRLDGGTWERAPADDALGDYYAGAGIDLVEVVTLPERDGEAVAIQQALRSGGRPAPVLRFDPEQGRWTVVAAPFNALAGDVRSGNALVEALGATDGGDVWMAARGGGDTSEGRRDRDDAPVTMYRLDDERHRPVFDDVPHPVRQDVVDATGTADGRLWVATAGSRVYRYDRVTGWDEMVVPGWQASANTTRAARANAIAVGPDGRGLVVGEDGRIANIGPLAVQLDAAAGTSCALRQAAPCGTPHDLHAAAVAPDGSAVVAGERRTILWRPAGQGFQSAGIPPGVPFNATFTGASMPTPDRAYLAASTGHVVAGQRSEGGWTWRVENLDANGTPLALDERLDEGRTLRLADIAVDAEGHGYAVGEEGLILERSATGEWKRLTARYRDDLTAIALSTGTTARGALIGAEQGMVLTLVDGQFRVARHADPHDPLVAGTGPSASGTIAGLALLPGAEPGQVEAWAAMQVIPGPSGRTPAPQALLHYTSNPDDELLDGVASVRPLPDAPLPRPGEIAFAAFGRSDCHLAVAQVSCGEMQGTTRFHEVVSRRIADELIARSKKPGGPLLALFTGDVSEAAGRSSGTTTPLDLDVAHRRWAELVAKRLQDARVPLYGAVGRGDLTQLKVCPGSIACAGGEAEQARTNSLWRETMVGMPEPWGNGAAPDGEVEFERVGDAAAAELPDGGANTHYAFDVKRDGRPLMRVVVVDTSHGSLTVSEREQQPVEPGGQTRWLDTVLCRRGSASDGTLGCTLDPQTPSVVVGNTPTYSYVPGAVTDTMIDAATFEATLLQHKVTTVVSGRLGWNGRYFATAPGLHHPCPGREYPVTPPRPGEAPQCEAEPDAVTDARAQAGEAAQQAADALQSLDPPPAPVTPPVAPNAEEELAKVTGTVTGLVDFVVASGAGGNLADERGDANDGYWHGYTIIRLMPGNDVGRTVVEQRPIFDWISVTADRRTLRPGGSTRIRGIGREPLGSDHHVRYDAINSAAITHRYDLVRADREKPWRPALDADGNYIPLPETVGRIDKQSGDVRAGAGNQERTYALAILSVGDKAAALPIAFEPRRSFQVPEPPVSASATNVTISAPPQQPPIIVLGTGAATAPPPTSPPPSATPSNLSPTFPPPLPFSAPPPINATPTAAPPPPPPAPPPPASEGAVPLNLSLKVSGLNIAPQMSTFPPPAPPVNPAPPGGARKEARQRQAAVAKSEQSGDGKGEGADAHGRSDAVDSPNSAMTRLEQGKGDGSLAFSAYQQREQPSAWARGALYGGGMTLAALLMAMTWTVARPRGRRRTPEVPAPAPAYARRRRT